MIAAPRPFTVIAELTYRCPLACGYCANPLTWAEHGEALDAAAWRALFAEAAELGVVQAHLTGGEPLLRNDLEAIIEGARAAELYTHLVTSGVPLSAGRLRRLRDAGLDALQLSFQDVDESAAARIGGGRTFARKREVAAMTRSLGIPLSLNVVLHRDNIERVGAFVALAEELGAERLELANVQYLGWALENRAALLPPRAAVDRARSIAAEAKARLFGRMEVVFVLPDYYAGRPRGCMDGWGRRFIVVSPDGLVQPCHLARTLPGLSFGRAGERPLADIWREDAGMNAFRGEGWMPEPCRSCDRRAVDFGGCRCQAYHLTGDAAATDPACGLAPAHHRIEEARREAEAGTRDLVMLRRRGIGAR